MIMSTRPGTVSMVGALCAATLLVGCGSATGGTGSTTSTGAQGGSSAATSSASSAASSAAISSGSSAAPGPGSTVTATDLASRMKAGIEPVTSVHLALQLGVSGQSINATGDQTLSRGALKAASIAETIPEFGDLTVVIIGRDVYVKVPPAVAKGDKRWFRVTSSSSNSFVRTLASTIDSLLSSASLSSFTAFAAAAKDITVVGPGSVGGVEATEYALTLDVTQLPADFPNREALQRTGLTTLPIKVWLDAKNRVVRVTQKVTVQGQTATTDVRLSDYDKPVTITPPPADQIAAN